MTTILSAEVIHRSRRDWLRRGAAILSLLVLGGDSGTIVRTVPNSLPGAAARRGRSGRSPAAAHDGGLLVRPRLRGVSCGGPRAHPGERDDRSPRAEASGHVRAPGVLPARSAARRRGEVDERGVLRRDLPDGAGAEPRRARHRQRSTLDAMSLLEAFGRVLLGTSRGVRRRRGGQPTLHARADEAREVCLESGGGAPRAGRLLAVSSGGRHHARGLAAPARRSRRGRKRPSLRPGAAPEAGRHCRPPRRRGVALLLLSSQGSPSSAGCCFSSARSRTRCGRPTSWRSGATRARSSS